MMLSRKALVSLVQTQPIYKMSLGKSARYEQEALELGALVFQSEALFHDAVLSGDDAAIQRAGEQLLSDEYPEAGAPQSAWRVWATSVQTFLGLQQDTIVLHWEAAKDRLFWGIVGAEGVQKVRDEDDDYGQPAYIFERNLVGG